jgi:hypothetical protein
LWWRRTLEQAGTSHGVLNWKILYKLN